MQMHEKKASYLGKDMLRLGINYAEMGYKRNDIDRKGIGCIMLNIPEIHRI